MHFPSVRNLCLHLISSAFQRCRLSEHLCRLSVVINRSHGSDQSLSQISISDTGAGNFLEEFQALRYTEEVWDADTWDGILSVRTTGIDDNEIYYYHINLRESMASRRIIKLPSTTKNGVKFSGTEVCISISNSAGVLSAEINHFFQKILILQIPNVTIDLVVEGGSLHGPRYENVFLVDKSAASCFPDSDVERLKIGFQSYVLRHGNKLSSNCDSCLRSRSHLKIGYGKAFSEGYNKCKTAMEVVLIISELSESNSPCCRRLYNAKTEIGSRTAKRQENKLHTIFVNRMILYMLEGKNYAHFQLSKVLYFKEFSPSSVPQSLLIALSNIDWQSYGLDLANVNDCSSSALIEWRSLSPYTQIDIVLHWYHEQSMITPDGHKTQPCQTFAKKAIKLALDDLKQKNEGLLLSSHALKICSYAPDLSKTIASFILFSSDTNFRGQCLSILGLEPREADNEFIEDHIKGKIISIVATNDRMPKKRVDAAPLLFVECPRKE